jgi:hypothetical protein
MRDFLGKSIKVGDMVIDVTAQGKIGKVLSLSSLETGDFADVDYTGTGFRGCRKAQDLIIVSEKDLTLRKLVHGSDTRSAISGATLTSDGAGNVSWANAIGSYSSGIQIAQVARDLYKRQAAQKAVSDDDC